MRIICAILICCFSFGVFAQETQSKPAKKPEKKELPKVDPKKELPKVDPKTELPKVDPEKKLTKEELKKLEEKKELEKETKTKIENNPTNNEINSKSTEYQETKEIKSLDIEKFQKERNIEKILQEIKLQQEKIIQDPFEEKPIILKGKVIDDLLESSTEIELRFDSKRLRGPSQFDSRIEVRQLDPEIDWQWLILKRNNSVGMVVEKNKMVKIADSIYQLDISARLGKTYNLCDKEPFHTQPVVGVGTAFIVDNQDMVTANHVFTKPLTSYAIVFNFEIVNKNGIVETIVHARDVYYPKENIKTFDAYDVNVFKVDRRFNRPILKWKNSSTLKKGNEIYMIGHPTGLPKKIAVNASMSDNNHPQYFYTSLDSFQGNSGSPVFDFESHKVIGVLVSGELDYRYTGSCYESTLCKIPYCNGEKVIRIENILNDIKQ